MKTDLNVMQQFAHHMWRHATTGDYFYDGRNDWTWYFDRARRIHRPTGTSLLFTRDKGMHTSGWFKNPDYDRCFHLSIGFFDLKNSIPRPFEPRLAAQWVKAFYGDWERYVWHESPYYETLPGCPEVHHYRVMCNAGWQPIISRKEVYTREFTEKGWKSFSDVQALAKIDHPSELD